MLMALYKPGQGYWTRMLTAIGASTLVLAGMGWIYGELGGIADHMTRNVTRASIVVGTIVVFGGLGWYLLNKPRIVDFMIATEAEMRKVNWPSRNQIIGSTCVVICGTAMMAILLWVVDIFFLWLFRTINVVAG
ncbi:MAG: preprotein translocase subunit SecE [Phycisphaeraceae bacterium]|nr:preprotein translocase subunit SecE [Phycisphaeraceae bacterium]|tara:strand:+ start:406 stop:807 length:402 start_codon:yes stop_codon:yes gene_type:complete